MKKKIIIIAVIVLIIILLSLGIFFVIKSRPKTESDKDAAESDVPPVYDGAPVPNITTYTGASFPLKKGMRGDLVANVQKFLGSNAACVASYKLSGASIPTADGVFGPITEKALKSCKGVTTVSKELYDQMVSVVSASAAMVGGSKVYLATDQAMLYSFPENKSDYFVGRVKKSLFLDKPIGTFIKDAASGYAQITVPGYEPYNKATAGYNAFKTETKTVYIHKSNLKKSAY